MLSPSTKKRSNISARIDQRLRAISEKPHEERSRSERWLYDVGGTLWYASARFMEDHCLHRARSLAYTSLLSLIPVAALFFAFFRAFQLEGVLDRVRDHLIRFVVPESPERLNEIVEFIKARTENVIGVGVFGTVFLLITLWSLTDEIETDFNHIWKIRTPRRALDKFKSWWSFLTLAPLLVVLSITLTGMAERLPLIGFIFHFEPIWVVVPLLITWVGFVIAYFILPNVKVSWRAAIVGGVLGGSMWELTKIGFGWYLQNYASYEHIYGSLALVPIFLISLYLTWAIVLFGAEVSFVVQNFEQLVFERAGNHREYREFFALVLVCYLIDQFRAGSGAVSAATLGREFGIRIEVVNRILGRLVSRSILSITEEDRYLLQRSPDTLYPSDIVNAVSGMLLEPPPSIDGFGQGNEAPYIAKIRELLTEGFSQHKRVIDERSLAAIVASRA